MTNTKKILIIGGSILAGVAIFAAIQYNRLMDYVIKPKSARVTKLTLNNTIIDVFILFTNNSSLKFDIIEQEFYVYLNDKFVTKGINYAKNKISANSTSTIGLNVQFNPSSVLKLLGKSLSDIILNQDKVKIKISVKLKVIMYGIKISIPPFVVEKTLKEFREGDKEVAQI